MAVVAVAVAVVQQKVAATDKLVAAVQVAAADTVSAVVRQVGAGLALPAVVA